MGNQRRAPKNIALTLCAFAVIAIVLYVWVSFTSIAQATIEVRNDSGVDVQVEVGTLRMTGVPAGSSREAKAWPILEPDFIIVRDTDGEGASTLCTYAWDEAPRPLVVRGGGSC
jgi:hypothetical protein